jgi:hypothetical protein
MRSRLAVRPVNREGDGMGPLEASVQVRRRANEARNANRFTFRAAAGRASLLGRRC